MPSIIITPITLSQARLRINKPLYLSLIDWMLRRGTLDLEMDMKSICYHYKIDNFSIEVINDFSVWDLLPRIIYETIIMGHGLTFGIISCFLIQTTDRYERMVIINTILLFILKLISPNIARIVLLYVIRCISIVIQWYSKGVIYIYFGDNDWDHFNLGKV